MSEPILRVKNLVKKFSRRGGGTFAAVDDVSFDVMRGECLGIIGESGSGKSTVANLITRLSDADEGSVFLDGEDITHAGGWDLRRAYDKIQMVFQTPQDSFDPRRTLGDGIGESLLNRGMKKRAAEAEVKRLLSVCGLSPEFFARYPHQASGGECQRAAIARAIAPRPELLICDEATSALDVTVQKEIIAFLRRLIKETGTACVFISHDIALTQDFCDRILVMYRGRIVESGASDEVIRSPKSDYARSLIDCVL